MRKFCIIIGMLWLCGVGCGESYEASIPSISFNFSCSLSQSPYYKITTPGQFLKVDKNVNGLPVGYAAVSYTHLQTIFQFLESRQEYLFNNLQITEISGRQIISNHHDLLWQ